MKKLTTTRLITFLLACYVLALTLAPCVDNTLNCCETQHLLSGDTSTGSHADQHDCCSPFCTCSCCNLAMEVTLPFFMNIETPLPQKMIFSYNLRVISLFSFSIWQPPKLS
jgi:hypothetical protein